MCYWLEYICNSCYMFVIIMNEWQFPINLVSLLRVCSFFFIADNWVQPPWSWDKSNCKLAIIRQYQENLLFQKGYYDHYGCKRHNMGWKHVPEIWEYVPWGRRRDVRGMSSLSLDWIPKLLCSALTIATYDLLETVV